jgi:hypothetical protein
MFQHFVVERHDWQQLRPAASAINAHALRYLDHHLLQKSRPLVDRGHRKRGSFSYGFIVPVARLN